MLARLGRRELLVLARDLLGLALRWWLLTLLRGRWVLRLLLALLLLLLLLLLEPELLLLAL